MKDDVSRQRIAQIRQCILRDIVVWTMQSPHRIVQFRDMWGAFQWLVYRREQKYKDGMKHCIRCQNLGRECWHPLEDFHRHERKKDGLSVYCKQCGKELNADIREQDPEFARERSRLWMKNHPEKAHEYRKRSYEKDKEQSKQRSREWQQKNAERWNAYNRNRYAQKKAERNEA